MRPASHPLEGWRYRLENRNLVQESGANPSRSSQGQSQAGATLANRYLIQQVIGQGGMGAVYRARDLHFPNVVKLVAVKEMIIQARDPLVRDTIVRNFEREANLLATLSHPAIPRIYDYFTQDERSYLILEFIQGKNLETIINEAPGFLPEAQVIAWAIELCDVLEYLHHHQPEAIIFRDMKPSNVMINQYNHVVLVDFGIAKTFQSGERGTMIGTEGYAPPEQYRGEASVLMDIYSLGATLHHALTRQDPRLEPPFSFVERPIREANPGVSTELEKAIAKSLEYDPSYRFASAEEMKQALLAVARKSGTPEQLPSLGAANPPGAVSITPLWSYICEDEIRGSATCDKGLVFFGSYDHHLYALSIASGKLIWRYQTDGGIVSRPATYGDTVCFGSEDRRLHVIYIRSGSVNWTYYTQGPVRSSPQIAHGHIFVGSDDGYLHAVNLANGRNAWQIDTGAPVRSSPCLSNEAIFFGNEAGDFICVDFRGTTLWRFEARRAITSSPVVWEEAVFFCSLDGTLYALEAKSGWSLWRFRLGKGSISTPCVADGMVYTGAVDGSIYCVDMRSGKEVWRYATEHQVTGSPIVYRNALYCGSVDGYLYCLDQRSGQLRWKYNTLKPITATPAAYEDKILIGSTDKRFYAFPAGVGMGEAHQGMN